MAYFEKAIDKTLKHEGNYVNDPDDPGGETKYGISKRAYPDVDIANLSIDQAKVIYKRDYWDKINGNSIHTQGVASSIFDFAVNVGVSSASKIAQGVIGASQDGNIGVKSIDAINEYDPILFISNYKLGKIKKYVLIVKKRPTSIKYLLGWINRTLEN